MTITQYYIRCKERNSYFVAWHGYSPFYSTLDKARRFDSRKAATDYANEELFTTPDAFEVVERSFKALDVPLTA